MFPGQIGSSTVRAALKRSYPTYAFLRTPSKLPSDLSSDSALKVLAGDAKDSSAVASALSQKNPPIDAVVVAAPMGDMRGHRSGYEEINKNIIDAVRAEQEKSGRKIRLWIMAGAAILEHPEIPGTKINEL
jgi:putative NADH-flavin reductase